GLCLAPAALDAAETAQARLFCLSVRFQQGTEPNHEYVLDLSSIGFGGTPNGELLPTFAQPPHLPFASQVRLYDVLLDEEVAEGVMQLDAPLSGDANQNGYSDFFEVSQGISGTSAGVYSSPVDSGTVRAAWSRAAGSKDGTCVLSVHSTGGF